MAWFRRRRSDHPLPPPPCPEVQRKIEQQNREAKKQLHTVKQRDKEVIERAKEVNRIRKENHLGPRFWDAMGLHRKES